MVDAASEKSISDYHCLWRPEGAVDFEYLSIDPFTPPGPDDWLEFELPLGNFELIVVCDRHGYRLARVGGLEVTGAPGGDRVEVALEQGVELTLELASESGVLPPDHIFLLLEERAWDAVRIHTDPGIWVERGGALPAGSFIERELFAEGGGRWVLRGLVPGRYRFKYAPDDLVFEPSTIELSEEGEQTVEVRWRYR